MNQQQNKKLNKIYILFIKFKQNVCIVSFKINTLFLMKWNGYNPQGNVQAIFWFHLSFVNQLH